MDSTDITVAYLACTARSGSTVLSRLAQTHPAIVAVGEIFHLWHEDAWNRQELCSCGQPLPSCPFWTQVMATADLTGADFIRTQAEVTALSYPGSSALRLVRRAPVGLSGDTREVIGRLYRAVTAASSSQEPRPLIMDASKFPGYADVLSAVEGVRVRIIHLVRDARGVYFSATRAKPRTDMATTTSLPASGKLGTLAKWDIANELIYRRWGTTPDYFYLSYDAFTQAPETTMHRLGDFLGIKRGSWVTNGSFTPTADHLIGSNPDRQQRSAITIRPDQRWNQLPPPEKFLASVLSGPIRGHMNRIGQRHQPS